jgi:hypothetical protein
MMWQWLAVDLSIHSNNKVQALAKRLGINTNEAVGLLVRLWAHAMRNADCTGRFGNPTPEAFAEALRCSVKKARTLLADMTELGLLEERRDGLAVHGWEGRQAAWYAGQEKRDYNKQHYYAAKEAAKAQLKGNSAQNQDRICVDSVAYPTVPNPTQPDPTPPNPTQPNEGWGNETAQPRQAQEEAAPTAQGQRPEAYDKAAEGIVSLYHELCPALPEVSLMTARRRAAAAKVIKQLGEDRVREGIARAGKLAYLGGSNKMGWQADFDWLMQGDNLLRVLEGRYDHVYGGNTNLDTDFENQNTYTSEQMAKMKTGFFDLNEL